MNRPWMIGIVSAMALTGIGRVGAEELSGITIELAAVKAEYRASDELMVHFQLTNNEEQAVRVLKWNTPLEGFNADMFEVLSGSARIPYVGRVVKRGEPEEGDFVELGPGQSAEATVNLAAAYPIAHRGKYTARFGDQPLIVRPSGIELKSSDSRFVTVPKRTAAAQLSVVEDRSVSKAPPLPPPEAKAPSYRNCSDANKKDVAAAHLEAIAIAKESASTLTSTPVPNRPKADRYVSWFGIYDSTRYDRATQDYTKVEEALSTKPIVYDCGCTENYYAYVYPTKPYDIYLCKLFWPAPLKGTDSKSGTIVHETTHFDIVANTDDLAYGQSGCLNLAKTDPAKALRNADSHEYFAENNPPKQMGP